LSWKAQAWAVDQRVGSPVKKLVLIMLAEAAHKETHRSWVSVERLSTECECDDRSVRKALKDLQESGHIADTGARVGRQKNVTVWSFPLFEASLTANPDKNVGVQGSGASDGTQAADLTSGNGQQSTGNPQPSQNCQGSVDRTLPFLPSNPDKNASRTPPKMGGESSSEPVKESKDARARATPSGSRGAKTPEEPPAYDEHARRRYWFSTALTAALTDLVLYGRAKYGAKLEDLEHQIRATLPGQLAPIVDSAINAERPPSLKGFETISAQVAEAVRDEMRIYKPAAPAERAAVAA
jgi:hypothetical protein